MQWKIVNCHWEQTNRIANIVYDHLRTAMYSRSVLLRGVVSWNRTRSPRNPPMHTICAATKVIFFATVHPDSRTIVYGFVEWCLCVSGEVPKLYRLNCVCAALVGGMWQRPGTHIHSIQIFLLLLPFHIPFSHAIQLRCNTFRASSLL